MSEATSEDTTASASHDPTPAISRTPSIDDNTKRYVFFALVTQLLTFPRMIEIFSSQPFTFVVGPDQTEFVVHSKLLERLSQPLHNLMNNGIMTESIKGIAYLDDIDSETFLEFVDFAYAFASISDTALEEEEGYVGWWWCGEFFDSLSTNCQEHARSSRPDDHATFHIACDAGYVHPSTDIIEAMLQDQRQLTDGISPVYGLAMDYVADQNRKCDDRPKSYLTSTAKLYRFADRYLVGGLKLVAVHKLRNDFFDMLDGFSRVPYSPQSAEDYLDLLNLAFEDDVTVENGRLRMMDLQKLVILIALHKRKVLEVSEAFWETLNNNSHIGMAVFSAWTNVSYALDWDFS